MKIGMMEIVVTILVAFIVLGPERTTVYIKKLGRLLRIVKVYVESLSGDLKDVIEPVKELEKPLRDLAQPVSNLTSTIRAPMQELNDTLQSTLHSLDSAGGEVPETADSEAAGQTADPILEAGEPIPEDAEDMKKEQSAPAEVLENREEIK